MYFLFYGMDFSEEAEVETIADLKLENENVCNKNEGYQKLVCYCLHWNFLLSSVWFNDISTLESKVHIKLLYTINRL